MKSQLDTLPDLINEDQRLYGLCFNDSPNLYNEMANLNYPKRKSRRYSSARTSISNTAILFGRQSSSSIKDLNIDTQNESLYQKLLISYDSKIKSIFDILVLIMVNISSLIILYDFCFLEREGIKNNLFQDPFQYIFFQVYLLLYL